MNHRHGSVQDTLISSGNIDHHPCCWLEGADADCHQQHYFGSHSYNTKPNICCGTDSNSKSSGVRRGKLSPISPRMITSAAVHDSGFSSSRSSGISSATCQQRKKSTTHVTIINQFHLASGRRMDDDSAPISDYLHPHRKSVLSHNPNEVTGIKKSELTAKVNPTTMFWFICVMNHFLKKLPKFFSNCNYKNKFIVCSLFWNLLLTLCWISPSCGQGPVVDVLAVAYKKAILPCDIVAPSPTDSTILVLWYKDLGDMPIYSYDGRAKPGAHAKNEVLLGQRAYFRTVTEPASLSIDKVSDQDAGLYRCRVDFLKSPTRNSKVNLTVIVPPQTPAIFDGTARELTGIAGPYKEGDPMTLTCIASGGRPPPKVTWWRGGSLIDSSDKVISSDGATQNTMTVDKLSRSDLRAIFTCQASNNNMSEPVSASVQVEMYFRPLEVTLLGSNQPMSALQEIEIVCQSVGSRPPAEISWYKDGMHLKSSREEVSPTGNVSTSVLKLTPRVGDHEKSLTCRAENTRLDGTALEDSWKLAVFFVPILTLKLGSNLDAENIRENDDCYFECQIRSNPWVYKVVWLHNGVILQHNASAGIIMSNQSLVLQKVKRNLIGQIMCSATNIQGDGRSNPVELKVMYKPLCKPDQKRAYGVAKGEQVEIECQVDSNPTAESFKWAFNNSADSIDVPQARYSTSSNARLGSSSILKYTPHTELDYGSVICLASNIIGQQVEACIFHIIPAGKPDPPFNCSVQNITSESLEVECVEGFDNGMPQIFHMDIFDAGNSHLLSNVTSMIPFFVVSGLRPGQAVRLLVYAANRKGGSERIIMEAQTIQEAEKRTATQVDFELTPVLGVCVGVVCGLLVVALGVVLALKFRTENRHSPALKVTKTEYRVDMDEPEEKNPDIIPSSKDSDYFYNDGLYNNGPKRNGSITENFQNCTYYSNKSNSEITYAELCLDNNGTGPANGGPGMLVGTVGGGGNCGWNTMDRKRRRNPLDEAPPPSNAIIYATIDHRAIRTNGEPPNHHHQQQPHQREIVSVRTPLLVNSQQESCV
ncbi:nephrin isoform X2 [Folsomia candida]|uniref:nephrin isoform X2 n=1 Tax=Folsomia candida TaxID=158441 RepID=UPI000B8FDA82|nr:nephrin isoform X2 [Folsomia candida]